MKISGAKISRILDGLQDLFGFEKRPVYVEIGGNFIKILETENFKGEDRVVRLVKRPFPPEDAGGESLGIARRRIYLNIPRHLVTVRLLRLPSTDEEEIKKIVRIESLKHVPYTDEAVIAGHRIVEKFEDGYSRVLLAIAQAKTIYSLVNAGVEFVSLGSEALFLWYLSVKKDGEKANVLLVNIDSGHIDIDIIESGKLVFTRGILYDARNPLTPEKVKDEIKVSAATYQKESNSKIDKVVVTGADSRARECEELLVKELKVPVEAIAQMENIPTGEKARIEAEGASFVELLGLSLKPEDIKIDLTPEDIKEKSRIKALKKNLTQSLILIAIITMAAFGIVITQLHNKNLRLSFINSELSKLEPRVADAKLMMRDMSIVLDQLNEKPLAIDVMAEIYRLTPSDISLNMVEYEGRKTLTVRGSAAALSAVFKYVTVLEGSPYFQGVKVKYATKRIVADREAADFEIGCVISKVILLRKSNRNSGFASQEYSPLE